MNRIGMKVLPVVLLIWPYLFIAVLMAGSANEALYSKLIWGYIAMTVVVYVMNIVNACLYKGNNACYELAFFNMIIKLLQIPFYLVVFLSGAAMFLAMVVPALIFISPVIIFILFVIDLLLLITTSMYGVNALVRAGKQGIMSKKSALVHGILHFFFVADVISSVWVFVKVRKGKLS